MGGRAKAAEERSNEGAPDDVSARGSQEHSASPETHRVAAGRVVFTVAPCGPDRRRGRRPSERPASVSQTQGGHTDDGQDLAAAGTTPRPAREARRGGGGGCRPVPPGRI